MMNVIKHRHDEYRVPKGYKPLYVGELFTDKDHENINHLNPYINELTGLYYLWKNSQDPVIGLSHFHRFFSDGHEPMKWEKLDSLATEYDIVLVNPVVYDTSVIEYLEHDFREDLPTFHKYMDMLYEKEPGLKEYFKGTTFNPRNMFVAKREVTEKYCEWLFPLIVPVAERFVREDAHKWGKWHYYRRMIGFIAERLLTYWVLKNELKYTTLPYLDL